MSKTTYNESPLQYCYAMPTRFTAIFGTVTTSEFITLVAYSVFVCHGLSPVSC